VLNKTINTPPNKLKKKGATLYYSSQCLVLFLTQQRILRHDTVVQTTGDSWHVPYDEDRVERYSYEVPTKWLCLHRKT
jgi:hypothetical protein